MRISAQLIRKGPPFGSVVGKLVYDADAKTITVVDAVYELGWPR